jgi:Fe-S-cluster containining protein
MITDLAEIKRITAEEDDENVRFRQYLKYRLSWSDRRVDEFVHGILAEVEAAIDCTRCANCCRVLEVSLIDADIARLAKHLGQTRRTVAETYAAPGESCERAFKDSPCAFLDDSRCRVYEARPRDCREYPHLQKGDFRGRMWSVLQHAEDCPIIFNVLRELKAYFWPGRS